MVLMSERASKILKADGWLVARTEQWVPAGGGGFRRDLYGWMDLMALKGGQCLGIQACAMTGKGEHLEKMRDHKIRFAIDQWTSCPGHRAELWAFRKLRARNKDGHLTQKWVWRHEVTDLGSPAIVLA